MSALCQRATLRKRFPRGQYKISPLKRPCRTQRIRSVQSPATPTKIADAANGMVRRCSCPQGKLALIIDNLHNFRRNTARSHQDFSTNRWAKILKADQGRGRMPEGARGAEYSNAQEARADRPQPKRSWLAKAANWLLSLRWIRTTKRITAIILTLGSAALIAMVLALIVRGVFANTISIRAITVPKALEERGFTAEVAAQRLRDAMTQYVRAANARMKGTDIELRSDEPNIILPAVNLSLDTVISALRTFFRSSTRRNISGDITDSESKLWLRLRLNGKIFYTSSIGVSADHPEELFDGIASQVLWQIHPYVVASEVSHADNAKALELVNLIVGEPRNQNEDVALSYNLKAIILRNRLQYDDGIKAAKRAIELDPQQANPHNTLGAILRDLGTIERDQSKIEEAIAEDRTAIALDQHFALPHEHLAEGFRAFAKNDEAIAELRTATKVDPKEAGAYSSLGYVLLAVGKNGEAMEQFRFAVDQFRKKLNENPKNASVRASLANALSAAGQDAEAHAEYNQAIVDFYKTIEQDPDNLVVRKSLAWALQVLDRHKDAIKEYQEITKKLPKDAISHLRLGDAFRHIERIQEALIEYQQALTEFSMDADFRPRYVVSYLNLAAALLALQRPKDAIVEYRKAIELEPKNAAIHVTLGVVLRDTGDKDGAIQEFQDALKIDPINFAVHRSLGEVLESIGRTADAIAEYRQASDIDQRDVSVHLNLIRLLRASGKEDEAAAEVVLVTKMDSRLFASERDIPKHQDAGTNPRDEIRLRRRH
jgi:tetratricopeptide (TPR) repeat protein